MKKNMNNQKKIDEAAYAFFRKNVPYLDEEQAKRMFDDDKSLTARAYKAGAVESENTIAEKDNEIITLLNQLQEFHRHHYICPYGGHDNVIDELTIENELLYKLVQEVYDNAWANEDDWNNRAKAAIDERGDE